MNSLNTRQHSLHLFQNRLKSGHQQLEEQHTKIQTIITGDSDLSAAFYKSLLKSTFGGTSGKLNFAHILHKDRP